MPFIVFEGIDACGKATQSARLAKCLDATLLSFPTYDMRPEALTGPVITEWLKNRWSSSWDVPKSPMKSMPYNNDLDAFVFQCVMAANKYELAGDIDRALDSGRSVVCDRYWPSAYAYGGADGLDLGWLLRLHEALPQPDIAFLLDIDFETSVKRRPDRRDRYEKKGRGYFQTVSRLYHKLWENVGPLQNFWGGRTTRWIVLDGKQDEDSVAKQVRLNIDAQFGRTP